MPLILEDFGAIEFACDCEGFTPVAVEPGMPDQCACGHDMDDHLPLPDGGCGFGVLE